MKTVDFTQMKDGTREDYLLLQELEHGYTHGTAARVLRELASQEHETLPGYKITRLDHALQCATRAHRDGADVDWVVAALLHDIGDGMAPQNHDRFAAEILRPYLREEVVWTVEHHGSFQMYYYAHHYGWNRHEREKYRDSPYFQSCADFCEHWDQASFDPDFKSEPLTFFEHLVIATFDRQPYDPIFVSPGSVVGLPAAIAAPATTDGEGARLANVADKGWKLPVSSVAGKPQIALNHLSVLEDMLNEDLPIEKRR